MSKGIRIERLQKEDVPTTAKFTGEAFLSDRQTQMKALGEKDPFDMAKYTLESMPGHIDSPRCHVIKAVDEETGEIMGVCNWAIRGFVPKTLPLFEERITAEGRAAWEARDAEARAKAEQEAKNKVEEPKQEEPKPAETDPIKRLVAVTNKDMNDWMEEVMPPGKVTKCMFIIGLTVSPKFQGRGAGSALLRWGTRLCDENDAFAWVHSSDPAWGMYKKSGFEVIRSLDIDLDEYAPCPPPGEGEGAKWGHYVFRYMKYFPKSNKE